MVEFMELWRDLKKGELEYVIPSESYSDCDLYVTNDYVFKQSTDESTRLLWKSKNIIQMLHDQGVKVPKVLFSSRKHNLVVYERIRGDNIEVVGDPKFARMTGSELQKMHKNTFKVFGEVRFPEDKEPTARLDSVHEYIELTINKSDQYMEESSMYRDLFREIKTHMDNVHIKDTKSTLCHVDLDMKNVICTNQNSYMIDFMGSEMAIPSMDVIYFYLKMKQNDKSEEFISEFLNGYGIEIADLPQYGIILATLRELSRMVYWEKIGGNRFDLERHRAIIEDFAVKYIESYNR